MTTPRGPVEPSGGVVDSVDDNSSRWEEFKPLITKLYIDLDMKLSTVQQYVKQHHDFDASKPMYKRKLRQWNLVKNMRGKEMEHILQTLKITNERELLQRSSDREIRVDGHKVRLSDVKRYMRRRQRSRTRSASDDEAPLQPDEHKSKPPRQTEPLGAADVLSTATIPGSPPASLFGADDSQMEVFAQLDLDALFSPISYADNLKDVEASECSSSGPRTELQEETRLFACPYHKRDPIRYSEKNPLETKYRRCSTVLLKDLPRLKQHIYRVHALPDNYCPRCFKTFSTTADLDSHARTARCLLREDNPFSEKATHDQMNTIKQRAINRGPVETWFAIYEILFPGSKKPLSPYADDVHSAVFQDFMAHLEQQGPSVMMEILSSKLRTTGLDFCTKAIVENLFKEIASEFITRIASDHTGGTYSFSSRKYRPAAAPSEIGRHSLVPRSSWVDQSLASQPWTPIPADGRGINMTNYPNDDLGWNHDTFRADDGSYSISLDGSLPIVSSNFHGAS